MSIAVALPILIALGAVMLGRDMGTSMVVAMGALGAVWVAGLPKRWFGVLLTLAVPILVFSCSLTRRVFVESWLFFRHRQGSE